MQRREDWATRLMTMIATEQARPFAWGRADCATLFAGAVEAVTGHHPFAHLGTWQSETGALRLLSAAGVHSVLEFCMREFDEIVPADARRGDVGFSLDVTCLTCPAVVTGAEAVSRDAGGWIVMPRLALVRAFKVGD